MDNAKRIVLQPSIWDTDNLGDLVAEGVIDCDDLSLDISENYQSFAVASL
jgi:hypothetical protein